MRRPSLLAAWLCAAISVLRCSPVSDPDVERARQLVEHGKRQLAQSQFQLANRSFAEAVSLDTQNNEAHFGHALSESLISFEIVSLIVRAAGFGDLVPQAARPGDGVAEESRMYNEILLGILLPFRDGIEQAAYELDRLKDTDFAFAVTSVPVKWNHQEVLNLRGTWRLADVRLLASLLHATSAVLDFVFAHDLQIDLFELLDYFTRYTGNFESFDFTPPELLNVVVHVLSTDRSELFTLLQEDADRDGTIDGEALPVRVRDHLRVMAQQLVGLRALAMKRSGVFRWVDPGGKRDILGTLDADVLVTKYDAKGRPVYGKVSVPITPGFEAGLNRLAANLDGKGERLNFQRDTVPVIAVLAVAVVGVIKQLDLDLSPTVRAALGLVSSPSTVERLVRDIIPDVIELDPNAYFSHPVGIRAFLPLYRSDLPEQENNFLFEWECNKAKDPSAPVGSGNAFPYYQAEGETEPKFHLTCAKADTTDADHFPKAATDAAIFASLGVSAIAADGIPGTLPYILFGDPDFDDVLYLKADAAAPRGTNPLDQGSFVPADQRSLNALLNFVAGKISF